jgi:hypothetical protein
MNEIEHPSRGYSSGRQLHFHLPHDRSDEARSLEAEALRLAQQTVAEHEAAIPNPNPNPNPNLRQVAEHEAAIPNGKGESGLPSSRSPRSPRES